MRTKFTIFVSTAIGCVFAFNLQSEEPIKPNDRPTFVTSPIGQELLDTLELAFSQRLDGYKEGRSGPEHAIRLNKNLFDEQVAAAHLNSRQLVAENYLARATLIEEVAKRNFANGTGLSQQLLEAKAARLMAMLACGFEKHSQRIVRVSARYPGAPTQEVADALASPIESKLRGLPHVDSITSYSSAEKLDIYIGISDAGHPQAVLSRIAAELESIANRLPTGAKTPSLKLLPSTATVPAHVPAEIGGVFVELKRESIAKHEIPLRNVIAALQESVGGNVSDVSSMDRFRAIRVTAPDGVDVPITELVEFRTEERPSHIVKRWPSE